MINQHKSRGSPAYPCPPMNMVATVSYEGRNYKNVHMLQTTWSLHKLVWSAWILVVTTLFHWRGTWPPCFIGVTQLSCFMLQWSDPTPLLHASLVQPPCFEHWTSEYTH